MSASGIISNSNGKIFDEFLPNPYPYPAQAPPLAQVLIAGQDAGNQDIINLNQLEITNIVQQAPIGGHLSIGGAGGDLRIQGATTIGSLLVGDGTSTVELPVGANGLVLKANSAQPLGVEWGTTLPFIPINRLINAPPTIRPIDDGSAGPAELTAGSFVFNVSDLYDPTASPATAGNVLMCEIFYQATFDKPLFSPARPLSGALTGAYVFNQDAPTSGAPFAQAPTQITFVFDYLVNGVPSGFTEKATIGQSTLTRLCPQVASIIPTLPAIVEGYNAGVHLIGGIDCSALLPTDVITFRLLGFTSFAGCVIDTTTTQFYFGQIGIKCYMARV